MILGLTGGIASGKSVVSKKLEELGACIIDADKISKEVSSYREILKEIGEKLGKELICNNKIDRKKLRELVFNNEEKRIILNNIMHPVIEKKIVDKIKENRDEEIIILDIPLLFEVKLEYLCDKVLLIWADEKKQIERLVKRDNISVELAKSIINSQMSLDIKKERSDYIVENNFGLEELKEKIETIYDILKDK